MFVHLGVFESIKPTERGSKRKTSFGSRGFLAILPTQLSISRRDIMSNAAVLNTPSVQTEDRPICDQWLNVCANIEVNGEKRKVSLPFNVPLGTMKDSKYQPSNVLRDALLSMFEGVQAGESKAISGSSVWVELSRNSTGEQKVEGISKPAISFA